MASVLDVLRRVCVASVLDVLRRICVASVLDVLRRYAGLCGKCTRCTA